MSTQEVVVNLKLDDTEFDRQMKAIEARVNAVKRDVEAIKAAPLPLHGFLELPPISCSIMVDAAPLKKVLADIHGKPVVNSVNEEIGQVTDARMTPGANVVADMTFKAPRTREAVEADRAATEPLKRNPGKPSAHATAAAYAGPITVAMLAEGKAAMDRVNEKMERQFAESLVRQYAETAAFSILKRTCGLVPSLVPSSTPGQPPSPADLEAARKAMEKARAELKPRVNLVPNCRCYIIDLPSPRPHSMHATRQIFHWMDLKGVPETRFYDVANRVSALVNLKYSFEAALETAVAEIAKAIEMDPRMEAWQAIDDTALELFRTMRAKRIEPDKKVMQAARDAGIFAAKADLAVKPNPTRTPEAATPQTDFSRKDRKNHPLKTWDVVAFDIGKIDVVIDTGFDGDQLIRLANHPDLIEARKCEVLAIGNKLKWTPLGFKHPDPAPTPTEQEAAAMSKATWAEMMASLKPSPTLPDKAAPGGEFETIVVLIHA